MIRGGGLGDFVLTLPVLATLRKAFPDARITILGYPSIAKLALIGGLADELAHIESRELAVLFLDCASPTGSVASFLKRFELIISYIYDPKQVFERNVRCLTDAIYIAGPYKPDESIGKHAVDCFLEPLWQHGIKADVEPYPLLNVNIINDTRACTVRKQTLAIHPGSGSVKKNWPLDRWLRLLTQIQNCHPDIFFSVFIGEAELHTVEEIRLVIDPRRVHFSICQPLDEVVRWLVGSHAYVGHDSGVTHLAAALSVPTLVLWGPSSLQVWRPPQPWVRILQHPLGISSIPEQLVICEIMEIMRW